MMVFQNTALFTQKVKEIIRSKLIFTHLEYSIQTRLHYFKLVNKVSEKNIIIAYCALEGNTTCIPEKNNMNIGNEL